MTTDSLRSPRIAAAPRAAYSGPDPRHTATPSTISAAAGGTALITGIWLAVVTPAVTASAESADAAATATDALCGALLLTSAILLFSIWRITGTTRAGWGAIAATVGAICFPVIILVDALTVAADGDQAGLVRGATKIILIGIGVAALRAPMVDARLRPARIITPIIALVAITAAAVRIVPIDLSSTDYLARGIESILVVGWLGLAAGFAVRGWHHRSLGHLVLAIAVFILGLGSLGRAITGELHNERAMITSGLTLVMVSAITAVAATRLWQLHRDSNARLLQATSVARTGRAKIADLESAQARRLHDARNAIFAIAGATELLAHPTANPVVNADHLHRLITTELDRLGHLLDPDAASATGLFTLTDVLDPLVAAYRAQDITIDTDITDALLRGNRDTLTNAVTNILTNARVHAPGAAITVTAGPSAPDEVAISIADGGPGIAVHDRARVLLPGVRGDFSVPGSGLGLASASQALSDLHGTLRITDRPGGGTMITMTLPAARR